MKKIRGGFGPLAYQEIVERFESTAQRLVGKDDDLMSLWKTGSVLCWTIQGEPLFIMTFRFTGL